MDDSALKKLAKDLRKYTTVLLNSRKYDLDPPSLRAEAERRLKRAVILQLTTDPEWFELTVSVPFEPRKRKQVQHGS